MKIKLDENLPIRLMSILKSLGHGVRTVGEEDLTGRADSEIWEAAQKEDVYWNSTKRNDKTAGALRWPKLANSPGYQPRTPGGLERNSSSSHWSIGGI